MAWHPLGICWHLPGHWMRRERNHGTHNSVPALSNLIHPPITLYLGSVQLGSIIVAVTGFVAFFLCLAL